MAGVLSIRFIRIHSDSIITKLAINKPNYKLITNNRRAFINVFLFNLKRKINKDLTLSLNAGIMLARLLILKYFTMIRKSLLLTTLVEQHGGAVRPTKLQTLPLHI